MNKEEIYPFDENLKTVEEKPSKEDDYTGLPPNDIVAYNELRSCADIVRMYQTGQLTIQPDFQRDLVWNKASQTRFIDSLIKQLPIPSMCISLDYNSNERLVIDGLQRISTIISFLTNNEYQLSSLDDIDPKISGKTVSVIKAKNKTYYERVEDLTIPITVLRCSYEKQTHMDYLFTIFHRLNSGGSKLNNQEIRNCIYNGKFNSLLKNSVKYPNYKSLFRINDNKIYRFAFEELNLRFLAFSNNLNNYNGRLAKFLNDYMYEKEKNPKVTRITDQEIEEKRKHFQKTIDLIYSKVFNNQSIEKLSKALSEAVLIGVGKNIDYIDSLTNQDASALFIKLKNDVLFSPEYLKEGLSQKSKVINRLNRAIEIFQGN